MYGDGINLQDYEVQQIITQIIVNHLNEPVIREAMEYAKTVIETQASKDQMKRQVVAQTESYLENMEITQAIKSLIYKEIKQALAEYEADPDKMKKLSEKAREKFNALLSDGFENLDIQITITEKKPKSSKEGEDAPDTNQ